jgi:PAS domain S-box-containing protein
MTRFPIETRIWLSIGIFMVGFLLTTVVSQVEQRSAEQGLAAIADAVHPAAQHGRDADAAFQRVIKGYSDAVLIDYRSGLDSAAMEGRHVLESLHRIGGAHTISGERTARAQRLAATVKEFLAEARAVYSGSLPDSGGMTLEQQGHIRRLAVQTSQIEAELQALAADLSGDLQKQMAALRSRSARMRLFMLIIFAATLVLAVVLVHLTIRRSVLVPLAKTQSALAYERDLLRILMDHIPDCIYFKDADSKFVRINKALAARLGIDDPADAIGRSDADYFDLAVATRIREEEQRILATGEPLIGSVEHLTRIGLSWWFNTSKVPVRDEARNTNMIVGISRDTTALVKAVDAMVESEESFRLLFDAIPHAVWVYDAETLRFLKVNEEASRQYGYSALEFEHIAVSDLHPPEEVRRLQAALAQADEQGAAQGAWKHVTRDGRHLDVEVSARVLRFTDRPAILAVVQDVSGRKRLELELQHAQRLEAVGHLAAGIAHEINTPIQFVGDNLHFLHDAFEDHRAVMAKYTQLHQAALAGTDSREVLYELGSALDAADLEYLATEIPKALDQSLDGVERVATIVRAMKAFAHPGQEDKVAADLNRALADTLTVARNELKYVADVETDFGELPPLVCHIADLNQVFLNLLINAAQAIQTVHQSTGAKGLIRVKTRQDGERIVISISDTGCGIPEALRSRIFDPFFTTKEVGRGTGQGLSLARSIVVDKHGGRIAFEPNQPQGTTFLVSLPTGGPHPAPPASVLAATEGAA